MAGTSPYRLTPEMMWTIILAGIAVMVFLAIMIWKVIAENPCLEIPALGVTNSACTDVAGFKSIDWSVVAFEKVEGSSKELLGEIVLASGDAPPPAEDHKHYGPVFGFKNEDFAWWAYAEINDAILFYSRSNKLTLRVTPTKEPGIWEGSMNNSSYRISILFPDANSVARNMKSWRINYASN